MYGVDILASKSLLMKDEQHKAEVSTSEDGKEVTSRLGVWLCDDIHARFAHIIGNLQHKCNEAHPPLLFGSQRSVVPWALEGLIHTHLVTISAVILATVKTYAYVRSTSGVDSDVRHMFNLDHALDAVKVSC